MTAGIALSGFGFVILFFPELLRLLAGGAFLAAGIPLILYGLKDDGRRKPPFRPSNSSEDPRIIYPEE